MTDTNIKTVQSLYEAFGRGDIGFILDQLTDDVDWASCPDSNIAPWRGIHRGKAEVPNFFKALGENIADHRVHAAVVHVERDRRHGGDALGRDSPGDREIHRDGHSSLVALPRRQDLLLPRHRGHRANSSPAAQGLTPLPGHQMRETEISRGGRVLRVRDAGTPAAAPSCTSTGPRVRGWTFASASRSPPITVSGWCPSTGPATAVRRPRLVWREGEGGLGQKAGS